MIKKYYKQVYANYDNLNEISFLINCSQQSYKVLLSLFYLRNVRIREVQWVKVSYYAHSFSIAPHCLGVVNSVTSISSRTKWGKQWFSIEQYCIDYEMIMQWFNVNIKYIQNVSDQSPALYLPLL